MGDTVDDASRKSRQALQQKRSSTGFVRDEDKPNLTDNQQEKVDWANKLKRLKTIKNNLLKEILASKNGDEAGKVIEGLISLLNDLG